MKRFLSLIIAAVMVLSLTPMAAFVVSAATASDEQGVVYDLSFDGTYYRVKSYKGTATDVVIPAEYEGLPVQEILDYAFYNSEIITSVVIGDSVTNIGNGAFAYCANLTSVVIGNSVTNIGDYAFAYSKNLTSIVIPESVTVVNNYVFYDCTSLTDIYCEAESQPESWSDEWNYALEATVHWGYGASSDDDASDDVGTEGLVFELSEDETYYIVSGYNGTESDVVIPAEYEGLPVKEIGVMAFEECEILTSIEMPDSIVTIGNYAFKLCANLTSAKIGNSVRTIGGHAFDCCESLTSIEIPDSVTSIGSYVFSGCDELASMVVSSGNTVYKSVDNCLIEIDTKTLIAGCKNSIIPADGSVTSIGDLAFYQCSTLTSIEIPDTITEIGNYAFNSCCGLTSVTIGSSVTSIGNQVFYCCENLTSIVIPESVTDTGYYVFGYCTNLTDIYCEAESQPEGWNTDWIVDCDATVHWGYGKEEVLLGDLNNDDVVDSFDYSLVKRACFGTYELSDDELVSADVNGDGSIDSYDFLLIKRIVLGNYK